MRWVKGEEIKQILKGLMVETKLPFIKEKAQMGETGGDDAQ